MRYARPDSPARPARRHVLFVLPSLQGGGAERVMVTLLRELDREAFRLTLAVVDLSNAVFLADLPDDVELIDLNRRRVREAVPAILGLVWRLRPDVLFSTLGHLNLLIAMLRPLLPRKLRFIARETAMVSHGMRAFRHPGLVRALYRRFYCKLDLVVCQSEAMREDVLRTFRMPEGSTVVVNNPVDIARVRARSQEPGAAWPPAQAGARRLVAVGRLGPEKGFDLLIEALALLGDAPPLQLAILGDGALRQELEALARARGVAGRVHFAGFQRNPYAWIAQADVFVLSSRHEGFPNVVLEALACGKPVVATPAEGGALEILAHARDCVVAEAVSAEALAAALRRWLAQPRAGTEEGGHGVPERFHLGTIVARYGAILQAAG